MELEWTKILEKPDAKYKVDGNTLLKFRVTTEKLNEELESLRKKHDDLENKNKEQKETIENLISETNELKSKISSLENEGQEKISGLENQIKDITASMESESQTEKNSIEETITQKQTEIDKLQEDLNEKTARVKELETLNNDLSEKNNALSERLEGVGEIETQKAEIENIQADLEQKLSEISQLNEKIKSLEDSLESQQNDHKQELEALQQKQSEEMEAMKVNYESQIQGLKEVHGVSAGEAALTGEEQVIMLRYTGTDFLLIKQKPDEGIVLIMDGQERKWLLTWDTNASFIDRRTAERRARSIAKSGWPLPGGARLGMGFEFEIQGDKEVPQRLLRDQHEYME